jgi:phospholipase C
VVAPAYDDSGVLAGATTVDAGLEYHTDKKPYGPGPRVPMYVVSPWSRGGWVNSQVFDHTSVLRFLEARFGVIETNISPYRRAVCGDLLSAFNFVNPNDPTVPVPSTTAQQTSAASQDRGTRPSRALPYELHVSARENANDKLQSAAGLVTLILRNTGKAAAVFHVYDRLHLDRIPRRYAVEPGKELYGIWDASLDAGKYDLWVLGPNGFHRAFAGDLAASNAPRSPSPEVRVCYDPVKGEVQLTMMNLGSAPCRFTVADNAYNSAAMTFDIPAGMQRDQAWSIASTGNWYDFTASVPQGSFSRRFAGRMETGAHGISDPAIAASIGTTVIAYPPA